MTSGHPLGYVRDGLCQKVRFALASHWYMVFSTTVYPMLRYVILKIKLPAKKRKWLRYVDTLGVSFGWGNSTRSYRRKPCATFKSRRSPRNHFENACDLDASKDKLITAIASPDFVFDKMHISEIAPKECMLNCREVQRQRVFWRHSLKVTYGTIYALNNALHFIPERQCIVCFTNGEMERTPYELWCKANIWGISQQWG